MVLHLGCYAYMLEVFNSCCCSCLSITLPSGSNTLEPICPPSTSSCIFSTTWDTLSFSTNSMVMLIIYMHIITIKVELSSICICMYINGVILRLLFMHVRSVQLMLLFMCVSSIQIMLLFMNMNVVQFSLFFMFIHLYVNIYAI